LEEDWDLIESSFAKQYGIRLRQNLDMTWSEFCSLLTGIMPDTPLGQVVTIRAEKDPKVIKKFSPDQKRIHREWKLRQANNVDPEQFDKDMKDLGTLFAKMFGKKEVKR
jgi:hypothetical protein